MKHLVSFGKTIIRIALQSVLLSAFCSVIQWLLNLTGLSDNKATWDKFFWGALGFFVLLFIWFMCATSITLYRMHKDPLFKDAHLMTGISWKNYKRQKETSEQGRYCTSKDVLST